MAHEQFRIHARTIDHLGQNQIADCPTAVSELWKNAYDAYARNVALHIFAKPAPMAAITDDGHGMSHDEFVERWLAVGTEHKASPTGLDTPQGDRNGLPPRPTQGQKGIGRLSVAHLGQVVLVLTKRRRKRYVAALVDWRVFENPFLLLNDIIVPVEEFKGPKEFPAVFERLRTLLSENVVPVLSPSDKKNTAKKERHDRIVDAWKRHDANFHQPGRPNPTEELYDTALNLEIPTAEQLECWPAWTSESEHGTALYVFRLHHELTVWVDEEGQADSEEAKDVKELLEQTLISFFDPYTDEEARSNFKYEVTIHPSDGSTKRKLGWDEVITLDDVKTLEHFVEGYIDEQGTFNGHVRAYGKDMGLVSLPAARSVPRPGTKGYIGPVQVLMATYEQEHGDKVNVSSMPAEERQAWDTRKVRYAGFSLYRDGLRVLPYGRSDADLFQIDERRQKHVGREFWAHRRMFARIAFTRQGNPNLIDKAGREGLQDNQARRELKFRVIDLLTVLARKYFGIESDVRKERRADAEDRKKKAIQEAGKRARKELRANLRKYRPKLDNLCETATRMEKRLARMSNPTSILNLAEDIDELRQSWRELSVHSPPKGIDSETLENYRSYRDSFAEVGETIRRVHAVWVQAAEQAKAADPVFQAAQRSSKLSGDLDLKINEWLTVLAAETKHVDERWKQRFESFRRFLATEASETNKALERKQIGLDVALERLQVSHDSALSGGLELFEGARRTLQIMSAHDVDAEELLRWSDEQLNAADRLHALAQLGVAVEIIGHEFESLDYQVRDNLSKLPATAKHGVVYQRLRAAHQALSQKIRFLSPLKLARRTPREEIRGDEIEVYLLEFFSTQLATGKVEMKATQSFLDTVFTEHRSRIYPVFVNIINNAIYWVSTNPDGKQRRILMDRRAGALIVADTGPGVDPDDVESLFELFFTRRAHGQGVGLYLCRQNLAAGGHRIEYLSDKKRKILSGANFAIHIRELQTT